MNPFKSFQQSQLLATSHSEEKQVGGVALVRWSLGIFHIGCYRECGLNLDLG